MQRAHLIISGDVQGVGFRAWVREQACDLGVAGWVRNRPDATVEVIAEGRREQLEELIKRCKQAPVAWVEEVKVTWDQATGEYEGFNVVR